MRWYDGHRPECPAADRYNGTPSLRSVERTLLDILANQSFQSDEKAFSAFDSHPFAARFPRRTR